MKKIKKLLHDIELEYTRLNDKNLQLNELIKYRLSENNDMDDCLYDVDIIELLKQRKKLLHDVIDTLAFYPDYKYEDKYSRIYLHGELIKKENINILSKELSLIDMVEIQHCCDYDVDYERIYSIIDSILSKSGRFTKTSNDNWIYKYQEDLDEHKFLYAVMVKSMDENENIIYYCKDMNGNRLSDDFMNKEDAIESIDQEEYNLVSIIEFINE